MKKMKLLLTMALAVVFAMGCFSPVYAGYMYDDDGNYIEYDEYDPYEDDEETDEELFYDAFSTSWFTEHPDKDEYMITTASQLEGLANLVNESHYDMETGESRYENFQGKTIILGRDITLRKNFTPIGRSEDIAFSGIFDGNGHTIKGVTVNENGGYAGLFGYLDGTVRDLHIEGTVKSTGAVCGSIAGYVSENGVIRNCTSDVTVKGKAKTGGIAGHNNGGTIYWCINNGPVTGTIKVGGIAGENWGTVKKCGNRGEIRSSLRGATTYGTGGVCGRSVSPDSVIEKCFNAGNIVSETEGTGGISGYMNARGSKITNCYNIGNIKVRNNSVINTDGIRGYAGGIVGIAGTKGLVISDCYNIGAINNSDISGGIIGKYFNESKTSEEPDIVNNYYLSTSGLKGIGSDNAGKSQNYHEGTEKIAPATLINGAAKLGSAYIEDTRSYYGADGYPVLKWQEKLGKVENMRLPCVSEDMQKRYDRFIRKNPQTERPEWPIVRFFNYRSFTSQAIGEYHEK